jgi:hypothetical protein
MGQDLAALAPSVIVCVAFLVGVGILLRRELGPKRRARANRDEESAGQPASEHDEHSES